MPRKRKAVEDTVTETGTDSSASTPEKKNRSPRRSPAGSAPKSAGAARTKRRVKAGAAPAPARGEELALGSEAARTPMPVAEPGTATGEDLTAILNSAVSLHEQIELLAYSYWEARGCQGGSPEEDWLRAEREIIGRLDLRNSSE